MRRSHFGLFQGALPLSVLLIATISCASLAGAPTTTPSPVTPTQTLPPVVQTADALSTSIAAYVASVETAAPGWTETAQVVAKETVAAKAGLTPAGKNVAPGTATATPTSNPATYATPTPSLPPAVQTADALNNAMATTIAGLATNAAGVPAATATAMMQTAVAQLGTVKTLGAAIGPIGAAAQTPTPPSGSLATATPTPGVAGGGMGGSGGGGSGGSGGSNGGGSGGGNGGGVGGGNGGGTGGGSGGGGAGSGPYVVKQIETLGGESISGLVCSITAPFAVNFATPKVGFTTQFVPQDATHGRVSYAYSIKSAGETHDAAGTYTLSPAGADGTLLLSMSVSDHVTFKGFDGNIPNRYKFDLLPSGGAPCP